MRDVTIIADDLTGAADCGIAFAVAGVSTFVSFREAYGPPSARIVAVDTDSRARPAAEAAERAAAAARQAYAQGSRSLYKKIDSTLRGHVGPELAAVASAARAADRAPPILIVAPAFPGTGRTMRDGRVLVGGQPLESTEVWRGSGMTGSAEISAMLRAAGIAAEVAALDIVRGGALAEWLADERRAAVICDAADEDDLRRIAVAGAGVGGKRPIVWVGSAGLARHLPRALGLASTTDVAPAIERDGPILALVGSRSTIAREQAAQLGGEAGVETFLPDADTLFDGPGGSGWSAIATGLAAALDRGDDAVLLTRLDAEPDLERAPRIAAGMAQLAAEHAGRLGGLIATGGDIARAALAALGAGGVQLLGEVEAGVPLGLADTRPPLPIVTKAGAFGTARTLVACRTALGRLRAHNARS